MPLFSSPHHTRVKFPCLRIIGLKHGPVYEEIPETMNRIHRDTQEHAHEDIPHQCRISPA